jgi:hypothetical protein
MISAHFLELAEDLELAGLVWQPEIGDEIARRKERDRVQILVDSEGMTPDELRSTYLWLPTVEQMVLQFEVRQTILQHAGLELDEKNFFYRTVLVAPSGSIESRADSLRLSLGFALRNLLLDASPVAIN